jgi:hypothetical protein
MPTVSPHAEIEGLVLAGEWLTFQVRFRDETLSVHWEGWKYDLTRRGQHGLFAIRHERDVPEFEVDPGFRFCRRCINREPREATTGVLSIVVHSPKGA